MRARLRDLTLDMNGKQVLSFTLDEDFRDHYDKYKEKPLTVEIKRYSPKRSKNANDYLWELCTRIAEDQHITKEEVYTKHLTANSPTRRRGLTASTAPPAPHSTRALLTAFVRSCAPLSVPYAVSASATASSRSMLPAARVFACSRK